MNTNNQDTYYKDINFSTTEINKNFKIKVKGVNNGREVDRIVGVSGLIDEIGDTDIVNSLLSRAFNAGVDKVVCRLRRGLKIIFYSY